MLGRGGTIVLPHPESERDPREWARLVRKHLVTIWNSVPAFLEILVDYQADPSLPQAACCANSVITAWPTRSHDSTP